MTSIKWRRVRAIVRKELAEYRRSGNIVAAMAIFPLIFVVTPAVQIFALPASAAEGLRHEHILLYMLGIPALVPAVLASYAVVGERQQGTLEPVLATPIRSREFLLGKALAAFLPTCLIAYAVFALFLAAIAIFAHPGIAAAIVRGSVLVAQLVFTPLLAAWSIWLGIIMSSRASDPRTAAQFGALAGLPSVAVTTLLAIGVIPATPAFAAGFAAVLLVLIRLGWGFASAAFDRERLVTGTR